MLTHSPEQLVSPVWHDSAHLPDEQTWPEVQAVAQVPQFFRSLSRLTQVPEQLVSPVWHDSLHTPAEQISPALQVVPHLPQL